VTNSRDSISPVTVSVLCKVEGLFSLEVPISPLCSCRCDDTTDDVLACKSVSKGFVSVAELLGKSGLNGSPVVWLSDPKTNSVIAQILSAEGRFAGLLSNVRRIKTASGESLLQRILSASEISYGFPSSAYSRTSPSPLNARFRKTTSNKIHPKAQISILLV
jgi:hypothetical protein